MAVIGIRRNGRRNGRGIASALRGVLLSGAVLLAGPAGAGPAEDAAAIQALLDAGKADEAGRMAATALADAITRFGPESAETADMHRLLGDSLFDRKDHATAEPHFRAALSIREVVLGPDHPDTARSAGDLAANLRMAGRPGEAEPYYRQALAIREKALGSRHADTVASLWRLALAIDEAGRTAEAATHMDDVAARGATAFAAPRLANALVDLGAMRTALGESAGAEAAFRQALAIRVEALKPADAATLDLIDRLARIVARTGTVEAMAALFAEEEARALAAYGPNDGRVADVAARMATRLMLSGRPDLAEPAFVRAEAIRVATEDASALALAVARENHAVALKALNRLDEAEERYRAAIASREATEGPGSAGTVTSLIHLANIVEKRDRLVEAEALLRKAIATGEPVLGETHALIGFADIFLGMLCFGQNRLTEAEPLLRHGIAAMEASGQTRGLADTARSTLSLLMVAGQRHEEAALLLSEVAARTEADEGPDSAALAKHRVNLADILQRLGRRDEAFRLAGEAVRALSLPPVDDVARAAALGLLGDLNRDAGRLDEAARLYAEVLNTRTALFGPTNRATLSAEVDLALVDSARGDDRAAAARLETVTAAIEQLAAVNRADEATARVGKVEDRAIAAGAVYDWLARTYGRLAETEPEAREDYEERAFLVAQRVIESEAAAALQQMIRRQISGTGALSRLLREREDLLAEWRRADRARTELRTGGGSARDPSAAQALKQRLDDADLRIRALDAEIAAAFPGHAQLEQPRLPGYDAVRAALGDNEVLLFYADMNRMNDAGFETWLWAVAKTGPARLVRLSRPTGEISAAVRHMRALMGVAGDTRGAAALGAGMAKDRPAAVLRAGEEIHKVVLAPVADMIAGRDLVIVPSKKLANLPFQLLVERAAPAGSKDPYRDAGWLVRSHAMSVLPSVAALPALKSVSAAKDGRTDYLAFANPLLTGRAGDDRRAFARAGCQVARPEAVAVAAAEALPVASFFRGGEADVAAVRALQPLPETVDEVCAVADAFGAGDASLRLGAAASEAEIRALSAAGTLEHVRILHFATHGLVSGELEGLAEPAIVLTPPAEPTAGDDGLLTASEVSTLKLDAEWVILSACNTASGEGGGEALSGLARAFFHAGARALMVSHWPVNSDAAVSLVTTAVSQMVRDPATSRADALQRAMVAEIDKGGRHADPANWAPFILVGTVR